MKQMKFLMVVFTLLTSISFTSCMGEGDPTVADATFGRVISTFPTVIETPFGVKFTAVNSMDLDFYDEYVYFQYSYNSDLVDGNAKNIDATITIFEKLKYRSAYPQADKGEQEETATVLQLGYGPESKFRFVYYDKSKIIVPVVFLMKEQSKESLEKHDFSLFFDEADFKNGEQELKLYLRHRSSEEKPAKQLSSYRLFDIKTAIERFDALTGAKPSKVTVFANETSDNTSDALDKKKDKMTAYTWEYNFTDTDK